MSKRKKKRRRSHRPSQVAPGLERSVSGEPGEFGADGVGDEWTETDGDEAQDELTEEGGGSRRGPGPLRGPGAARRRFTGSSRGTERGSAKRSAASARTARAAGRGRGPQDPQPPILAPLARSLVLVGTSPLLLGTAFASVLVIWLIYSSSGVIRIASPASMAQIQSLLPLHSLLDLQFMFASLRVFSAPAAISLSAILLLVRAAFLSLILALIVGRLDARSLPSAWRDELRIAGRRAFSVFQFVFAVEAGMVVAVYALSSILGAFFGVLGLVVALMAEMYLLTLAPIVATTERVGAAAAVRLSTRAARLRGPQHLTLAFAYVFATLYIVLGLRGSPASPVTPSIAVWAYVLFATFVNVSLLAALTYRWLLVRDVVGADEERERTPRSRRAFSR
jgi:hypothetical protein